jgi:hypothetical protein
MRFNLRKAVRAVALPVLGGTLAAGAAALPAGAQTWQDTALQVVNLQTTPSQVVGAVVDGVASGTGQGSTLSFTAPSGETFTSPALTAGTTDASLTTSTSQSLVLTSTSTGTGTGTLTFTIGSATSGDTLTAAETVQVSESSGTLAESAAPTSAPGETVTVSAFNNRLTGSVEFYGNVTAESGPLTFSLGNLPAGLVLGNPLVPGNAVPGTYALTYTIADALGSTFSGTFGLEVFGPTVVPPSTPSPPYYTSPPYPTSPLFPQGDYGDAVNPFGNGFDVYQQHRYAGAIVVGWTATQADPATHFIIRSGTVAGAYTFEYAPNGVPSGLSVSDPGGGWTSDPMTDGLILTPSNNGPWQQFIPQSNGTLKNVATGLVINPDGTGVQLRGGAAPTSWGGSVYTWIGDARLPF